MKTIKNSLLLLLLLIGGAVYAQKTVSPFSVSPEKAISGELITITYNPKGTVLEGKDEVAAVIYLYRDFQWSTEDLDLKKSGGSWAASYKLPDNCAFFACKFKSGDIVDSGSKTTYGYMTTDKSTGRNFAGAYPAWGMLRNTTFADQTPKCASDSAMIGDDVMLYWINQELLYHPESRVKVFYPALTLVKKMGKENATAKIEKELKAILSLDNVDENAMIQVQKGYAMLLGDYKRADSLGQVMLGKYPKGITARDKAIVQMFREPDYAKKAALWSQFGIDFPAEKFKNVITDFTDLYLVKVYRAIAYEPIMNRNDYTVFEKLLPESPIGALLDYYYHVIEVPLERNDLTAAFLLPYATKIMKEIEDAGMDKSLEESRFYSPKEWKTEVLSKFRNSYLVHANLLNQVGDYKNALEYMEKVKGFYGYKTAEFNSLYVELLNKNGRSEAVLSFIEKAANENAMSEKMIEILKSAYISKNKSEVGFEAYFNSLKSKTLVEAQREELKKSLIKKKISSFNLESINGSYVDLSKQKGKIVVLDLWATWCVPCKAALPGMQLAVDKYKNDPNVAFYFIATDETDPNYRQKIKDYIKLKNYTINVLYDAVDPQTKKLNDTYTKYCKEIGFSGIPQKIIIDGDGNMRWQSTGYKGSPSALADEISCVIELLKAEK